MHLLCLIRKLFLCGSKKIKTPKSSMYSGSQHSVVLITRCLKLPTNISSLFYLESKKHFPLTLLFRYPGWIYWLPWEGAQVPSNSTAWCQPWHHVGVAGQERGVQQVLTSNTSLLPQALSSALKQTDFLALISQEGNCFVSTIHRVQS